MAQKSITDKIKEAGKHGLIYGFGSIAQSAAGFLLLPLYAKHLAPHDYGIFSLIQMIGIVLGAVFYLGASSALPRSYFDYEDSEDRKKVFNTTLLLLLIGATIQVGIGLLFSDIISKIIIGSKEYGQLVLINLISSAITFTNTGFIVYLRLLRKSKIIIVMSIVNLFITVSIIYYLLVVRQLGIAAPIYAMLCSQIITASFFILYLRKSISLFSILKNEIAVQLKFGIPSVLASTSLMVTDWGDRIILNQMLTTADVGIYSMGFRIAMLYNILIMVPFSMIWHPMMMEYRNDKNLPELFKKITYYYTLVSITLIMFSTFFLDDLLELVGFGDTYSLSITIIPFIMIGLFLSSLQNIFSAGLFYERKPIYFVYICLPIGIINIFLNILLIPIFNIWGAVIAGIFSRFSIALTVYIVSGKYFKFELGYMKYFKMIACVLFILIINHLVSIFYQSGLIGDFISFTLFFVIVFNYLLDFNEQDIIKRTIRSLKI